MDIKKIYKYLFLIMAIYLIFLFPTTLLGDDTLVGGNGYTVFPINTDKIQMLSEHVKITMGSYNSSESAVPIRKAFVRCIFVFKNISNKGIKAIVGFPTDIYDGYGGLILPDLNDFTSYISGRPVKVEIKKEIIGEKTKIAITAPTFQYYEGGQKKVKPYRYWYTWEVNFPALKKVVLKNSYWITLSSDQEKQWFDYILTTGANWKGNIGKAVIEVIYPSAKDLKKRVIKIEPEGYMTYGNKIYWEFKNFKPKTDIKIIEKYHVNELNIRDFQK